MIADLLQPQHQSLNDDSESVIEEPLEPTHEPKPVIAPDEVADTGTSEEEEEDEWNPFGEYEEEQDELEPSWQDEQKNRVDAILSRRRRGGDEMKDTSGTSTTCSSSDIDASGVSTTSGGSTISRGTRRTGDRRGGRSSSADSTSSNEEAKRLRRERRRGKRSSSRTGASRSRSRSTSRPLGDSSSSGKERRLAGTGKGISSRNVNLRRAASTDGSSRNLNLGGAEQHWRRQRGTPKASRSTTPRRTRSHDGGLEGEAHTSTVPPRRHPARTKTNARARSHRNLLSTSVTTGSTSGSNCTNTAPSGLHRTSSSPSLNPDAPVRLNFNNPEETIRATTSQSRRVKKTLSPKRTPATTTSRPTSRKASCVMLLRSSSTSRLQLPNKGMDPVCE